MRCLGDKFRLNLHDKFICQRVGAVIGALQCMMEKDAILNVTQGTREGYKGEQCDKRQCNEDGRDSASGNDMRDNARETIQGLTQRRQQAQPVCL